MHWIALRPTPDAAAPAEPTLADVHTALAWGALRFTPLVARVEDALVLEVSASERLFGGRSALLQQFFESNQVIAPVECAQGATSLIALGRLWGGHDVAPEALSVHTLAAARPHLPMLARLGVRRWGQLRALPRGGLVRRFGAELVDALDCAWGQRPEVYPWLTLPEVFDAPLELAASVESAPALLFGARRLLAQLLVWLRARQRGVLALELCWDLDARRANTRHVDAHHTGTQQGRLELRTAQATQDMAHLQRILGEQLARVTLPAPVLTLRLRSLQTQPLAGESHSLLPDEVRRGDSLHQTLERLAARLGAEQLQCTAAQADHRPEHMQRWAPWSAASPSLVATKTGAARALLTGADGQNDAKLHPQAALWPTWLLPSPQRLAVRDGCPQYLGSLTLLAGPQRLEAGWLDAPAALRDYYIARSPQAGWVWVYRERSGPQGDAAWYLHGLYG
ncbi:DNA polymerase Y family protein [uncultured Rhodoferax sp.]|uniref:Y-family DNA polymerase n=1 Tax=uncultured Rhodoferax sp. TaxID=223188 RepID=UPI0025F2E180|nr:DNA polymerase Y family protein [uncultured Rhodoferax sp.]